MSGNEGIPYVREGKLYNPLGEVICAVGPKTGWPDWLSTPNHRSFRFEGAGGFNCSMIKERRKTRSGDYRDYWYAHRHVLGKLKRVYLGKPERLTIQAMTAATIKLAQLEMMGVTVSQGGASL